MKRDALYLRHIPEAIQKSESVSKSLSKRSNKIRPKPVPIPNMEVKPSRAHGTPRATAWESRSSPGLFR